MSTKTHTSIYRTWLRRLGSGTITQAEARQYVQAVIPLASGLPPSGRRTNLTVEEAQALGAIFRDDGLQLNLTPEHTQKGLDWLRKYGSRALVQHSYLDHGDPNPAPPLPFPTNLLTSFSRFTFNGCGYVRSKEFGGRQYVTDALPVWRVHFGEGTPTIDYYCGPWQSLQAEVKGRGLWWWSDYAAWTWPTGVVR